MPKVDFSINVEVRLQLQYNSDIGKSLHKGCDYRLSTSSNTDVDKYYAEDDLPNAEGTDAVVKVLASGLAAAIHAGHQRGYKNDAVCLREVIKLLEDQFILHAKLEKGKMP